MKAIVRLVNVGPVMTLAPAISTRGPALPTGAPLVAEARR